MAKIKLCIQDINFEGQATG